MSERFSEMAAKFERESAERRAKAHVEVDRPMWHKRRRHAAAFVRRHKRFGREFITVADTATLLNCPVSSVERLATSGQLRFGVSPGDDPPSAPGRRPRPIRVIQPLSILEFLGLSEPGNPGLEWLPGIGLVRSRDAEALEQERVKREQEFIDFVVDGCRRELVEEEQAREQAKQEEEASAALLMDGPPRDRQDREYMALVERAAHLLGMELSSYVRQVVMRQAAQDIHILEPVSGPSYNRRW